MTERHVYDEGGVRLSIFGHLKLAPAVAEEVWEETVFPLFVCRECAEEIAAADRISQRRRVPKSLLLLFVLGVCLYLIWQVTEVLVIFGLLLFVGLMIWGRRVENRPPPNPLLVEWLQNIRWMPEALAMEDEYELAFGAVRLVAAQADGT